MMESVLFYVCMAVVWITSLPVSTGPAPANFSCYTCSYQHPPPADFECVDKPSEVKTAKSVLCTSGRVCVTREVFSTVSNVITSFNRDCQVAPVETGCDPSGQTRVCTLTCESDFCNREPGGTIQDAVKRRLTKQNPHSLAAFRQPCWSLLSTIVIIRALT